MSVRMPSLLLVPKLVESHPATVYFYELRPDPSALVHQSSCRRLLERNPARTGSLS